MQISSTHPVEVSENLDGEMMWEDWWGGYEWHFGVIELDWSMSQWVHESMSHILVWSHDLIWLKSLDISWRKIARNSRFVGDLLDVGLPLVMTCSDIFITSQGHRYKGQVCDGCRDGKGSLWHESGDLRRPFRSCTKFEDIFHVCRTALEDLKKENVGCGVKSSSLRIGKIIHFSGLLPYQSL